MSSLYRCGAYQAGLVREGFLVVNVAVSIVSSMIRHGKSHKRHKLVYEDIRKREGGGKRLVTKVKEIEIFPYWERKKN